MKVNADRLVMVAMMMISEAVVACFALPFVALPTPETWPYIWLSTVLHTAYFMFLIMAYRYGDLSHVYPIARGSSPMLVALLSVVVVGELLSRQATAAVVVISLGVMSLALTRGSNNYRDPKAIFFALGTGLFIAAYTVVDGLGARAAESAHSYVFWLNIFDGIPIIVIALYLRKDQFLSQARVCWKAGVCAGVMSLLAYWIVLWAMTLAPLALVSAVRETSMVFAVVFGVFFLKERLKLMRLISTVVTLIGVVILKVSK